MSDKVVHFEIPADDVERARKFYKTVFSWGVNTWPGGDYTLLQTGPTDAKTQMAQEPGFINGGMMKRQPPVKNLVITIQVDKLDSTVKKIEKSGGRMMGPKELVPGIGYAAYFQDPEGNVVGLIEPLPRQRA